MWETLYSLLIGLVGSSSSYLWADYTCQVLATIGVVLIFAIPFVFVFWCVKAVFNLFGK